MKRFAQIIFFLVPLSVFAQEKGALISFETDTIDYGEILKGSNGVRTFTFQNIGDVPIEIQGVKSSCGCTVPKKPNAPIPPGERAKFKLNMIQIESVFLEKLLLSIPTPQVHQ